MANASDYLEQQIYNHIFRNATFAKPASIYIGLTKDVPLDDGTYVEIDGAGYARYANASGDAVWSAHGVAGPGSNDIEFAFPTASADWGVASGVVITDSATPGAGNVLLQGALTTPKTIESGDTFRFSVGSVDVVIS